MKRVIAGIIGLAVVLTGCGKQETFKERVEADVVRKEYQSSWIQPVPVSNGKTFTTTYIHHSANHYVELGYGGLYTTVDDQWLYESVAEGDKVTVDLYIDEENLPSSIKY